jgi:DNA-binding transcriptional regulator YiaG
MLINASKAAQKYGISHATLLNWIKAGTLPAKRFGNALLIEESYLIGKRPQNENLYLKLSNKEVGRISFEIWRYRNALDLTQKEFGEIFNVRVERIGRAERGEALSTDLFLAIWRKRGVYSASDKA